MPALGSTTHSRVTASHKPSTRSRPLSPYQMNKKMVIHASTTARTRPLENLRKESLKPLDSQLRSRISPIARVELSARWPVGSARTSSWSAALEGPQQHHGVGSHTPRARYSACLETLWRPVWGLPDLHHDRTPLSRFWHGEMTASSGEFPN